MSANDSNTDANFTYISWPESFSVNSECYFYIDRQNTSFAALDRYGKCHDQLEDDLFIANHLVMAIELCLIVVMFFFQTRKRLFPTCCKGRPGLIYPVEFLDEWQNRFAVSLLLGVLWYDIWSRVTGTNTTVDWTSIVSYAASLVGLTSHSIVGYTLFVICKLYYVIKSMYLAFGCIEKDFPTPCLIKIVISTQLVNPILVFLIMTALYKTYKHVNNSEVKTFQLAYGPTMLDEENISDARIYVQHLFKANKTEQRVFKVPGFRYTVYPFSAACAAILSIFFITIQITAESANLYIGWRHYEYELNQSDFRNNIRMKAYFWVKEQFIQNVAEEKELDFIIDLYMGLFWTVLVVMFGVSMYNMYAFVRTYRSDLIKVFRGQKPYVRHLMRNAPVKALQTSSRFIGNFVGYAAVGYVIQIALIYAVVAFITLLFLLQFRYSESAVWSTIKGPFIVAIPAIVATEVLANRFIYSRLFVLSANNRKVLAIDNRRIYNTFGLVLSILTVLGSFLSCLFWRLIFVNILNLLTINRADKCTFPMYAASLDPPFCSYESLLAVEGSHRNPVSLIFTYHLKQGNDIRKQAQATSTDVQIYRQMKTELRVRLNALKSRGGLRSAVSAASRKASKTMAKKVPNFFEEQIATVTGFGAIDTIPLSKDNTNKSLSKDADIFHQNDSNKDENELLQQEVDASHERKVETEEEIQNKDTNDCEGNEKQQTGDTHGMDTPPQPRPVSGKVHRYQLVKSRWSLAITLANNPKLVQYRAHSIVHAQKQKHKLFSKENFSAAKNFAKQRVKQMGIPANKTQPV